MTPAEELKAAIEKSRAILEQIRKLINEMYGNVNN